VEADADETDATLVFQKSEVQKWQAEAADIYARACARADGCTLNPLFARTGNGEQLYRSLVEATCIRLFHARLIERALVDFANMQDGWRAIHEADIPTRKPRRKADCLAINERTGLLFVFEAKRGTRHYSAEEGLAIDDRLCEIVDALESRTRYLGWRYRKVSVFVLSFYGANIPSVFDVHNRETVDAVFGGGIAAAARHMEQHLQRVVQRGRAHALGDQELDAGGDVEEAVLSAGQLDFPSVFEADLAAVDGDTFLEVGRFGYRLVGRDRFEEKRRERFIKQEGAAGRNRRWQQEKRVLLRRFDGEG
jgi:hypothetical protein